MDLLTCICGLLGKSADLAHMAVVNDLSGRLLADPHNHETAGIFHDALQDAGVSVDHSRHPIRWPGMEDADLADHSLHQAYRAANNYQMHQRLRPVVDKILSARDGNEAYGYHYQASAIAAEHGNTDLARSHRHAARNWNFPGVLLDGRTYWMSGLFSSRSVHPEMYALLANPAKTYDTHQDAWDDFHQAHAAWMKDQNGG